MAIINKEALIKELQDQRERSLDRSKINECKMIEYDNRDDIADDIREEFVKEWASWAQHYRDRATVFEYLIKLVTKDIDQSKD